MTLVVGCLAAGQGEALHGAAGGVAQENVPRAVVVTGLEVDGQTLEGDVGTVAADASGATVAQGLNAAGADADACGCTHLPVEEKHVLAVVGVAGDQVRRAGL